MATLGVLKHPVKAIVSKPVNSFKLTIMQKIINDGLAVLKKFNTTTYGPELVVNGSGDSIVGWGTATGGSVLSVGGELEFTSDGIYGEQLFQTIGTVPGKTYLIAWQARKAVGNPDTARFLTGSVSTPLTSSTISYSAQTLAMSTSLMLRIQVQVASAGSKTYLDNVSVREVLQQNKCNVYLPGVATPILGPNYLAAKSFATSLTGWSNVNTTSSIVNNEAFVTGAVSNSRISTTVNLTAGTRYFVSGSARNVNASAVSIAFNSFGLANNLTFTSVSGKVSGVFIPSTSGPGEIRLRTDIGSAYFGNISVCEITGYNNQANNLQTGNHMDTYGTQPNFVDQPVGLVLDAANSTLGPELVLSGEFATATGWTLPTGVTVANGTMNFNAPVVYTQPVYNLTVNPAASYLVKYTISSITSGCLMLDMGFTSLHEQHTAPGTYSFIASGLPTSTGVSISIRDANTIAVIDNVSVREVIGVHAIQGTAGSKPTLRLGLVNLLTYSADLTYTNPWSADGVTVSQDGTLQPDGSLATKITMPTVMASNRLIHNFPTVVGPYTLACLVKAGTSTKGQMNFDFASPNTFQAFDTANLTSNPNITIVPVGGGWYCVAFQSTQTAPSGSQVQLGFYSLVGKQAGDSMYYGRVGVFQGSFTASQIQALGGIPLTTTAAVSTLTGPPSWQFDGTADYLSLSTPLFQLSDDHCVVAGFKAAGSGNYVVFEASGAGAVRGCSLRQNAGSINIRWDDGTANAAAASGTAAIGEVYVHAGRKVGNTYLSRKNGTISGGGAGATLTAPLTNSSIGARGLAATEYAAGNIYPVIVIKGTVSDTELLALEKFVAQLSGITL